MGFHLIADRMGQCKRPPRHAIHATVCELSEDDLVAAADRTLDYVAEKRRAATRVAPIASGR